MQTLSPQFYGRLNNNLETGVIEQHDNINAIKGKILLYSLALQLNINNIIKKAAPLLRNSDKEPFIDNVCCNDNKCYSFKSSATQCDKSKKIIEYAYDVEE